MMKNVILIFFSFAILLSCQEKPTYNPFDTQFSIDESYFVKDKLDTIWDTCGYYGLVKKENDFEMFYGYLENDLLGKGFSLNLDTIKFSKELTEKTWDSINNMKIRNSKKINDALDRFNYVFERQSGKMIILHNGVLNKIDTAYIDSYRPGKKIVYRRLSYINRNKNTKIGTKRIQEFF